MTPPSDPTQLVLMAAMQAQMAEMQLALAAVQRTPPATAPAPSPNPQTGTPSPTSGVPTLTFVGAEREVKMYYCWLHGWSPNATHNSGTCNNKKDGHQVEATSFNRMGGSTKVTLPRNAGRS